MELEMNHFIKLFFITALITTPSTAKVIHNDQGGAVITYALQVAKIKRAKTTVHIVGQCNSACTLYLGLPSNLVCISSGASFGFHKPFNASKKGNRIATQYMLRQYPSWVRSWIVSNGGLSSRLIVMNYKTASQHLKSC